MTRWTTLTCIWALAAAAGEPPCPHHPAPKARAAVSTREYQPPEVRLVDQDGARRELAEALASRGPLALNFIFTTCTTVCPVMGAGFAGLRKRLGDSLQLVSISIDPEHDRPAALKAWAARFGGDAGWRLYTGSAEDIRAVLEAFDASRGDKSNHQPFTLLRRANAREWVRVDGLASTEVLVDALTAPTASK